MRDLIVPREARFHLQVLGGLGRQNRHARPTCAAFLGVRQVRDPVCLFPVEVRSHPPDQVRDLVPKEVRPVLAGTLSEGRQFSYFVQS